MIVISQGGNWLFSMTDMFPTGNDGWQYGGQVYGTPVVFLGRPVVEVGIEGRESRDDGTYYVHGSCGGRQQVHQLNDAVGKFAAGLHLGFYFFELRSCG